MTRFVLLALLALLAASRQAAAAAPIRLAAKANNHLAWRVHSAVTRQQGPNQNCVVAPISVMSACGLLLPSADKSTKKEILGLMLGPYDRTIGENEFHASYTELLTAIRTQNDGCAAFVTNGLFLNRDRAFDQNFLESARTVYRAGLFPGNFSQPRTVGASMNRFVSQGTRGKITHAPVSVEAIQPDTNLILLSCFYFLGPWSFPFPAENDQVDAPFSVADGSAARCRLMHRKLQADYAYLPREKAVMVSVPYRGGNFHFLAIKPVGPASDLPRIENAVLSRLDTLLPGHTDGATSPPGQPSFPDVPSPMFDEPSFQQPVRPPHDRGPAAKRAGVPWQHGEVDLYLPCFSMRCELDLREVLPEVFGAEANYPAMLFPPRGSSVGEARHVCLVDVGHHHTEAAAVTSSAIAMAAVELKEPVVVRFDQSFVFLFYERSSRTVLLLGRVFRP